VATAKDRLWNFREPALLLGVRRSSGRKLHCSGYEYTPHAQREGAEMFRPASRPQQPTVGETISLLVRKQAEKFAP
jgi:hypothetical protein